MARFTLNSKRREFSGDDTMPLLWYLREELDLKGTKFGCGVGECGACTVHLNGQAVHACVTPMRAIEGSDITTIEGVANGTSLHAVQRAWIAENVPQCGYCQPGQIMATIAFLKTNRNPTDDDIDAGISNLCRCGTYYRIRKAIHRAAAVLRKEG